MKDEPAWGRFEDGHGRGHVTKDKGKILPMSRVESTNQPLETKQEVGLEFQSNKASEPVPHLFFFFSRRQTARHATV